MDILFLLKFFLSVKFFIFVGVIVALFVCGFFLFKDFLFLKRVIPAKKCGCGGRMYYSEIRDGMHRKAYIKCRKCGKEEFYKYWG